MASLIRQLILCYNKAMSTENRSEDYVLSVNSDSLTSMPYYRLYNDKTHQEFKFDKADLDSITKIFNGSIPLYLSFFSQQGYELRAKNNPINWNTEIVNSRTPREGATERVYPTLNPDRLVLKSDLENLGKSSKVPVLVWSHQSSFDDSTSTEIVKSGWMLQFSGLDTVILGFAEWNDDSMILQLIEKMRQPKELLITLLLMNPKESARLNEKEEIFRSMMEDLDDIGSGRKTQLQVMNKVHNSVISEIKEALEPEPPRNYPHGALDASLKTTVFTRIVKVFSSRFKR